METYQYQPLFELTRGEAVESVHFGAIAIADARGNLIASYADPCSLTFLRSAAKPFQLMPFIENGGQAHYGLSLEEVSVMCASHAGTDAHVEVLRSIHAKTGVKEEQLQCGIHPLSDATTVQSMQVRGETPTPIRHNCSGKHTGMLAFAGLLAASSENYLALDHAVQRAILETFAQMCNLPPADIALGTDGCSAPNFAAPLENVAAAYARLCDPHSAEPSMNPARLRACQTITQAMYTHANMVAGPGRFDTQLMTAARKNGSGVLISKGGAEGYQAIGLLPGALGPGSPGIGIAFKISDGDLAGHSHPAGVPYGHVRPAIALEILSQLGYPLKDESLANFGPTFPIHNWRGLHVGDARPCFRLEFKSPVAAQHLPLEADHG